VSWVQSKYIVLVGSRLRNFKRKKDTLYNFACPFCLDSEKNKRKARGYLYSDKNKFKFKCFNCGKTMGFDYFLKSVDMRLYNEYRMEVFRGNRPEAPEKNNAPAASVAPSWRNLLQPIQSNPEAFEYLKQRKIPLQRILSLYTCSNLNDLKVEFPNYEETEFPENDPRIVVPVLNQNSQMIGLVCRSIKKNCKQRYINLRKSGEDHLIFNLDKVDRSKPILVFEGSFDAMFFDNAVAVDGADFTKAADFIEKTRDILVYDNTPKNRELLKHMEKTADAGYRLCIWPDSIKKKDVNEMVLDGVAPSDIQSVIEKNAFAGMRCKLELAKWRKR
jgi:hypothetical protein